jgi:hypothetical protein
MFITVEATNPRTFPNTCAPEVFLNFNVIDPNGQELKFGSDFNYVGGGLFHATVGDMAMEHTWIPGEYNLVVTNWADGTPATDYIV